MATWTTAYVNDLPDSAFLYVESGTKDMDGRTTPRSKRHFPFKDANGKVDHAHVANAIARAPQSNLPKNVQDAVQQKGRKALEKLKPSGAKMDLSPTDVHVPGVLDQKLKPKRKGLSMRLGFPGGHTLEIMHGASPSGEVLLRGNIALSTEAAGADDQAAPVWVQIAKCGAFEGHPAGAFELTPAVFADIVRNFNEVDGKHVFFDFEHASEEEPSHGNIAVSGAPAQGRLLDLENRGTAGLWGLAQWMMPARQYIREGKYTSLSPAIRFNARHPVTGAPIGARLTSVALTNRPFLRGLAPLAAKDKTALYRFDEMMPRMRSALKLSPLASAAECKQELGRLRALYEGVVDPRATVQGVDLQHYTDGLMGLMGVGPAGLLEDLLDAVEEMIDAAIARHVVERHEGAFDEPDDDETAGMAVNTMEMTAMSDESTNASRIQELEQKVRIAEADKAAALLALAERDSALTVLAAKTMATEQKLDALMTDRDARMLADRESEVDAAIDAYGLSRDRRGALVKLHTADTTSFRELYPQIPVQQRHLARQLTTREPDEKAERIAELSAKYSKRGLSPVEALRKATDRATSDSDAPAVEDLVRKYRADGLSLEEACVKAEQKIRKHFAA